MEEVRRGRKTSHWMWFVFPQLRGLGASSMAYTYGIENSAEAEAYLQYPVLGPRLVAICETLLQGKSRDAHAVFGSPDDLKLRSCVTLFARVPGAHPVFKQIVDAFFNGQMDAKTLNLLS